jgi:biotin transport system substrate-specific component
MIDSTTVTARPKNAALRITLTALFAALIAGGGFISIPLPFSPVPIVLQNLFIVLAGLVLGPMLGSAAVLLYLMAGALGLPVFAGAAGGIARFSGPTGGFLVGYFFSALTAGIIAGKPLTVKEAPLPRLALAAALGFLAAYIPGLLWLFRFVGTWPKTIVGGLLPFLPGDLIKAALVTAAAKRLRRIAADKLDG